MLLHRLDADRQRPANFFVAQPQRDVSQHLHGLAVSPVQIIEDDQQRRLATRTLEQIGETPEQHVPFTVAGITARRVDTGASRQRRYEAGEVSATVGDMGYFDEDGYLFIADRKTDMVISGGVNIYPREIEEVLITHPKILDVAVLGVPDPEWGEQLKAVVQLKPGESVTEEEIIAFARERLADYKSPRSVDFVAELPREPSGKLYKRKLKEQYWAGREKMV